MYFLLHFFSGKFIELELPYLKVLSGPLKDISYSHIKLSKLRELGMLHLLL